MLSKPHLILLLLSQGLLNRSPAVNRSVGRYSSGVPSRSSLTNTLLTAATLCISRGHLHVSFYNTHTIPFNLLKLPLIFTGASCAENLWLTARSRINMQQMEGNMKRDLHAIPQNNPKRHSTMERKENHKEQWIKSKIFKDSYHIQG